MVTIWGWCLVFLIAGQQPIVQFDYKTEADPTCPPFEPQACHVFVTESTFGLPLYRWQAPEDTYDEIAAWWRANADAGRASLL